MESGSKLSNIFPRKRDCLREQEPVLLRYKTAIIFLIHCTLVLPFEHTFAQDIEPRRWTPLPAGTNVLGAGFGRMFGDVFFDPLLQVENAEVEVDTLGISYVRSFSLAGKLARFDALLPWHSCNRAFGRVS